MAEEQNAMFLAPFMNFSGILGANNSHFGPYYGGGGAATVGNHGNNNNNKHLTPASASADTKEWGTCHDWQDAQHTLFQLANLCAAVSLLTPSSFRHHLLFLRCLLLVAYLLFVLWAGLFVCMLDVLVWNCTFFLVDFVHIIILAYTNIPSRFNPSLGDLFTKKLKPLKVCRQDFANLCNTGNVLPLRKGARYSIENVTPCGEKVSILLRGRLKVSHEGMFLHSVEPNEFVDSIEFDSVSFHTDSHEKFQVTITASEDSLLISWLYPTLRSYLASNPFIWTVYTNLVGKDISDKLYRIQELLIRGPDEVQGGLMPRNSSMVNVRKCLHTTDPHQPHQGFVNASLLVPEAPLSLGSTPQQVVSATVETSV